LIPGESHKISEKEKFLRQKPHQWDLQNPIRENRPKEGQAGFHLENREGGRRQAILVALHGMSGRKLGISTPWGKKKARNSLHKKREEVPRSHKPRPKNPNSGGRKGMGEEEKGD